MSRWGQGVSRLVSGVTAAAVALGSLLGGPAAVSAMPLHALAEQQYEQQVQRLHHKPQPRSNLPSSDEAAALQMLMDPELFTPEAWQGMLQLQRYASYVEQLAAAGVEEGPGCESCTANRMMLEKAWQTVAAEFFDPHAEFNQARWASQLLTVLKAHDGTLRTRADTYKALTDLVGSLGDKYSAFLDPSAYRRAIRRPLPAERNYLAAQFVGVGIQFGGLDKTMGGRIVEGPLGGSSAEAAGVRKGDRVLVIDGLPAESLTLDETITLLRGPVGSTVSLVVAPAGSSSRPPRVLELERRQLPQPALREAHLPLADGRFVQYVRLHYFSHETTSGLYDVVAAAEADGRVAGYVLDLRNDPGGVFEEAVAMAALFQDPRDAVANTVRSGSAQVDVVWRPVGLSHRDGPDVIAGPLTSKPLVLLVNGNTASASEVLAGALHDNSRAVLMGEKTFGKGVVQFFFPMGDGSGLKLTVAKYLTPKMYDISKDGGLSPDFACKDYPHGVFTPGKADRCVTSAMDYILTVPQPDPLSYSPLLADVGDKQ